MWNKPLELTKYPGKGYEISAWFSENITASQALDIWKNSHGHNEVITNKGIWADVEWQAIGIGIYDNYANVWFGKEYDTRGSYTIGTKE